MTLLADGNNLAVGLSSKKIAIRNVTNGRLVRTLDGHFTDVRYMVLMKDGSLASGDEDGKIFVFNVQTGDVLATIYAHNDYVAAMAVLNDGKLVSASQNGAEVKVWQ